MSRVSLLAVLAVMGCSIGCAQCDTCDDFPVPCVGPNCGQLAPGGIPGMLGDSMGPPVMGSSMPTMNDSAPAMPAPTSAPMPPPVNPSQG